MNLSIEYAPSPRTSNVASGHAGISDSAVPSNLASQIVFLGRVEHPAVPMFALPLWRRASSLPSGIQRPQIVVLWGGRSRSDGVFVAVAEHHRKSASCLGAGPDSAQEPSNRALCSCGTR